MALQSLDNIISAISAMKTFRADWNKVSGAAAYTAGRAYEIASLGGFPVGTTYPGVANVAQTYQDLTGDGTNAFGIPHGGNVMNDVKHLLSMSALGTAATAVPCTLMLCDFLMGYSAINTNLAISQTVTASSNSGLYLTLTVDYPTFTKVRFTTTTTLPTGLSLATDYWIVRVDATHCRVATTLNNAIAGTVIAYTDAGTGTHTMTIQTQGFVNSNVTTFSSSTGLLATYTNDFTNYTQVRFSNSGGALPTGIAALTDYWLIRQSSTTAKIATSLVNAVAGTYINWTDNGTGVTTMTVQIPRYTDGKGVRAFLVARATTGANANNISYGYTNQNGTTNKVNPVTVAATVSAIVPHIIHSGIAANNYTPFLPLASGDTGMRNCEGVGFSAATGSASTAALVLVKPLAVIPIGVAGLLTEKDLLNQIPSLPRIYDSACLGFIILPFANLAAATTLLGHTEFVYG
jgi:hypothetical protein